MVLVFSVVIDIVVSCIVGVVGSVFSVFISNE